MADSAYLRDKMAQAIVEATHVSLHTDDPAGTGANEVTGGDPPYARVPITGWAVAGDGLYQATLDGVFNLPANTSVTWVGLWNGTTYLDKAAAFASTVSQQTVQMQYLWFQVP